MALGLLPSFATSLRDEPAVTLRCLGAMIACIYIAWMNVWSYYMACAVPPGTVRSGLSGVLEECRTGVGSSFWWEQINNRVAAAAHSSSDRRRKAAKKRAIYSETPETLSQQNGTASRNADLAISYRYCKKCEPVPLAKALACLPPELRLLEKNHRREAVRNYAQVNCDENALDNASEAPYSAPQLFEDGTDETEEDIRAWLGPAASEKLVLAPKPERAHHCRTCRTCILKYDHHCPWINQCVGIGNERYFVLFMLWFSLATLIFSTAGFRLGMMALRHPDKWASHLIHRIVYLAFMLKASVMGVAVFVLACWHIYMIMLGETTIENQDNANYRRFACERNAVRQNRANAAEIHECV